MYKYILRILTNTSSEIILKPRHLPSDTQSPVPGSWVNSPRWENADIDTAHTKRAGPRQRKRQVLFLFAGVGSILHAGYRNTGCAVSWSRSPGTPYLSSSLPRFVSSILSFQGAAWPWQTSSEPLVVWAQVLGELPEKHLVGVGNKMGKICGAGHFKCLDAKMPSLFVCEQIRNPINNLQNVKSIQKIKISSRQHVWGGFFTLFSGWNKEIPRIHFASIEIVLYIFGRLRNHGIP